MMADPRNIIDLTDEASLEAFDGALPTVVKGLSAMARMIAGRGTVKPGRKRRSSVLSVDEFHPRHDSSDQSRVSGLPSDGLRPSVSDSPLSMPAEEFSHGLSSTMGTGRTPGISLGSRSAKASLFGKSRISVGTDDIQSNSGRNNFDHETKRVRRAPQSTGQSHQPQMSSAQGSMSNPIEIGGQGEDANRALKEASTDKIGYQTVISEGDFMTDSEIRKHLRRLRLEEQGRQTRVMLRSIRGRENGINFTCAPGKNVEFRDGTFMRINSVFKDGNGQVFIEGKLLERGNGLDAKMPRRRNELVWMIESRADGNGPAKEVVRSLSEVARNREVVFTNQPHPQLSSLTDSASFPNPSLDVKAGALFCRWKRTIVRSGTRVSAESIESLRYEEADDQIRRTMTGFEVHTRVKHAEVREKWRGVTPLGGSHLQNVETININDEWETGVMRSYTFGDAFCGAGGASKGARDAGLFVRWGFDSDEEALRTYMVNFEPNGTKGYHEPVHIFLRRASKHADCLVDVIHISPPCQPFSPAHTVPSLDRDEKNQAALFSVMQLIETIKPRIITMEETEGLLNRHGEWFSALIHVFIHLGYSVRWKVVKCEEFGVPQARRRLFIIAAGYVVL